MLIFLWRHPPKARRPSLQSEEPRRAVSASDDVVFVRYSYCSSLGKTFCIVVAVRYRSFVSSPQWLKGCCLGLIFGLSCSVLDEYSVERFPPPTTLSLYVNVFVVVKVKRSASSWLFVLVRSSAAPNV